MAKSCDCLSAMHHMGNGVFKDDVHRGFAAECARARRQSLNAALLRWTKEKLIRQALKMCLPIFVP
ncbi:MAG TPA: hypothetical protein DEQ78_02120 [Ruminococcaceae bacterium]|nr:hypothetical protein [Oscillospiraceae bacterium]